MSSGSIFVVRSVASSGFASRRWVGSAVGLQMLHICLEVGDAYAGGTLNMDQRQPTGGNEALDRAQGNTEHLGGVALSDEQPSGHARGIGHGVRRVEHCHVLKRPGGIGQESNKRLDLDGYSSTLGAELAQISG